MSQFTPYLFVYGTLRRDSDHPMAGFLGRHGRFVARAKSPGRLYQLGAYPGMLPALTDSDWVHGDLFEMSDPEMVLAELDKYEGCVPDHPQPYIFERALATVTTETGTTYSAWVYYHESPIDEGRRIPGGEYRSQKNYQP